MAETSHLAAGGPVTQSSHVLRTVVMNGEISYRDQICSLYHVYFCCKFGIFNKEGLRGMTCFWSLPQVAIQGTAVFGTSALALFYSPRDCRLF